MFFTPGVRHLDGFRKKAEESGKPLPISISRVWLVIKEEKGK